MEERRGWRERWREIIFEAETPAGRTFDVVLLWLIGLSVAAVMAESVRQVKAHYGLVLFLLEWGFTLIFTLEYLARLVVSRKGSKYATSFFGVVDLVSFLPSYVALIVPGAQAFMVVRILRMLRMFRVLKMVRHVNGAEVIMRALLASRAKVTVFFFSVLTFAVIAGTLMYLIEGEANGFTSIPVGIYWAIVTITTVGFGDIYPKTAVGQWFAAACMLIGYAIIAVPTGIISAELVRMDGKKDSTACPACGAHGHLYDSRFCRLCGEKF